MVQWLKDKGGDVMYGIYRTEKSDPALTKIRTHDILGKVNIEEVLEVFSPNFFFSLTYKTHLGP